MRCSAGIAWHVFLSTLASLIRGGEATQMKHISLLQVNAQRSQQGASIRNLTGGISVKMTPAERLEAVKPIRWLHVPKCGTTFENVLLQHPDLCPGLPPEAIFDDTHKSLEDYHRRWNIHKSCPGAFVYSDDRFSKHLGLGNNYKRDNGHLMIMLRQPEQRLISAYHDDYHDWPLRHTFPPGLVQFAKYESGCAVRMLNRRGKDRLHGQLGGPCTDPPLPSEREVDLAKLRLREGFAFVGITDEWDLSICLFHKMFGGPCKLAEFQNARPGSQKTDAPYNTSVLQGYTDPYDGALYEEGLSIFNENLQQYDVTPTTCEPCYREAGANSGD